MHRYMTLKLSLTLSLAKSRYFVIQKNHVSVYFSRREIHGALIHYASRTRKGRTVYSDVNRKIHQDEGTRTIREAEDFFHPFNLRLMRVFMGSFALNWCSCRIKRVESYDRAREVWCSCSLVAFRSMIISATDNHYENLSFD